MDKKITSQDLLNLIGSLTTATQIGWMAREHAKGVFLKALDESGFNTPKPEVKTKEGLSADRSV